MLVWQGSFDKMNGEEFKELSMDDKMVFMFNNKEEEFAKFVGDTSS